MADTASVHDLAQEAFDSRKFELAAEIYEKIISQNGPNFRTYVLLGDAYSRAERLREALESYSTAFRLEPLKPEHLRNFIGALLDIMRKRKEFLPNRQALLANLRDDHFTCFACRGLLFEPVTIPCGHSFCRKCVSKDATSTCKACGKRHLTLPNLNVNVSLQKIVEKLFPRDIKSICKKDQGNKAFNKGRYQESVDLYTEALALTPVDHIIFSNRSNVYHKMKQFREAEIDADNAIRLRPDWSKGYFRKAQAQVGQNKFVDASATYLQCLLIDESKEVKTHLAKILISLLDPLSPSNQELKSPARPSPGHSLLVLGLQRLLHPPQSSTAETDNGVGGDDGGEETSLSSEKYSESAESAGDGDGEPAGSDDSDHEENFSLEAYNILPLLPNKFISKSLPSLEEAHHLCADSAGIRKGSVFARTAAAKSSMLSSTPCLAPNPANPEPETRAPSSECLSCRILAKAALASETLEMTARKRKFDISKLEREDYECSLCLRIFWEPITTSCGHTFCRGCLDRVTDHSVKCPLCKQDLADYLRERQGAPTRLLERLVKEFMFQAYEERKKIHEDEMEDIAKMGSGADTEIPIFVCTLAFPTITCPLHVFEPRYRLMVRQAMESGTRQFGMCLGLYNNPGGFANYGTILEIQDVSYFPDGRSVVNTIGERRFKVLSRGMREGYNTAKVEFLRDEPETEPAAVETLTTMERRVYDMARHWFTSLPSSKQHRITSHFGQFPQRTMGDFQAQPQGPPWIWWAIAVLPIDQLIQFRLLSGKSLRERLNTVQSLLLHFSEDMGIRPLPHGDPRLDALNEIRNNMSQGTNNLDLEVRENATQTGEPSTPRDENSEN